MGVREDRRWMCLRLLRSLLDVYRQRAAIERDELSEALLVLKLEVTAAAHLHLLRRIAIAVDERLRRLPGRLVREESEAFNELEPGDRLRLVDQLLRLHVAELEVLPPADLVL